MLSTIPDAPTGIGDGAGATMADALRASGMVLVLQ